MKSKLFFIAPLIGAALLAYGCATRTSGIAGSAVVKGPGKPETRIIINNPSLTGWIKITDIKSVFVGDLLEASVTVTSRKHYSLNLQYKFFWYNSQGIEIDSGSSPWIPLVLYGKEVKQIQAVAPNPSAKEFKVEIRDK